jgi:tRNA modification GTPase
VLSALVGAQTAAGIIRAPRQCRLAQLSDPTNGRVLDQALVTYFAEGASYTGEPSVELSLHGGAYIRGEVLQTLAVLGCRPALAGEFSFRAVRNGCMTLDQAESVRDLIESNHSVAHGLALDRLSGSSQKIFSAIAEDLRSTMALAEAGIDFSDQDLDELALNGLKQALIPAREFLQRTAATLDRGRRIQDGPTVAIAGLPNAGKSSLFNELLGSDRSLISDEAGTTRDIIREQLRLPGLLSGEQQLVWISDTAGLRETAGRVESMGIARARSLIEESDWVLFVVDPASHPPEVLREWRALGSPSGKALIVLHKADLFPDLEQRRAIDESWRSALGAASAFWVSSQTGEGLEGLSGALGRSVATLVKVEAGEFILTRIEQQAAVLRAKESLDRAIASDSHELFAADLRSTLEHLSFFIGKTPVEETLGRIFSQFCIGK